MGHVWMRPESSSRLNLQTVLGANDKTKALAEAWGVVEGGGGCWPFDLLGKVLI